MPTRSRSSLIGPVVATGVLMAAYLLLRPYRDSAGRDTLAAAQAYASPWWLVAHVCGALALVSFALLAVQVGELSPGRLRLAARWTGLIGAILVLPYYGSETFALHAIGIQALGGAPDALVLVPLIQDQPLALASFGLGLLALAASGILTAVICQRHGSRQWCAQRFSRQFPDRSAYVTHRCGYILLGEGDEALVIGVTGNPPVGLRTHCSTPVLGSRSQRGVPSGFETARRPARVRVTGRDG